MFYQYGSVKNGLGISVYNREYTGPVEWKSKLQSIVALSSMEAEYVGACEITKIISWLSQCLDELRHVRGTTRLKTDNLSSKTFAEDDMVRARSKHVDIKFHYVRDQIKKGLMKLEYCPTGEMIADALTKPLNAPLFKKFRGMMGIKPNA